VGESNYIRATDHEDDAVTSRSDCSLLCRAAGHRSTPTRAVAAQPSWRQNLIL